MRLVSEEFTSSSSTAAPACASAESRSVPLVPFFARAVAITLSPWFALVYLISNLLSMGIYSCQYGSRRRFTNSRRTARNQPHKLALHFVCELGSSVNGDDGHEVRDRLFNYILVCSRPPHFKGPHLHRALHCGPLHKLHSCSTKLRVILSLI